MKLRGLILLVMVAVLLGLAACGNGRDEDELPNGASRTPLDNATQNDASSQDREFIERSDHGYIAMQHIRFMNDYLYRRPPFTYRELETALWIVDELKAMGHEAVNIEVQQFHVSDVSRPETLQRMVMFGIYGGREMREYSQNVVLTIPGQSERVIIIGAHYDTVQYVGASDNASGVALLLESAQRMLEMDNYYTLVYVFFGAEEIGLYGAEFFVGELSEEQRENIIFMFNADVLFEGPYLLYMAGVNNNGFRSDNEITAIFSEVAYGLRYSHGIELITYHRGIYRWLSDHMVFFRNDIPVVCVFGLNSRGDTFDVRVLHSYRDCYHYITERWPGKMEENMWAFSVFLEALLMARF